MPPFLASFGFKAILGAILFAVITGGALYIKHIIAENAVLSQQLDQAVATNKQNLAAFADYRKHEADAAFAVAAQHAAEIARLQQSSKLKQDIARAPQTDNGSVAPVLARTLDALRVRNVAPANPGQNPAP